MSANLQKSTICGERKVINVYENTTCINFDKIKFHSGTKKIYFSKKIFKKQRLCLKKPRPFLKKLRLFLKKVLAFFGGGNYRVYRNYRYYRYYSNYRKKSAQISAVCAMFSQKTFSSKSVFCNPFLFSVCKMSISLNFVDKWHCLWSFLVHFYVF